MTDSGPCNTWVTHDLSTFVDGVAIFGSGAGGATYSAGVLSEASPDFVGHWHFTIPAIYLPTDKQMVFEVTFGAAGHDSFTGFNTFQAQDLGSPDPVVEAGVSGDGSFFSYLTNYTVGAGGVAVATITIEPDDPSPTRFPYFYFSLAYGSGTTITQIRTMLICPAIVSPHAPARRRNALRLHPRNDGLGTSTAPRLWPQPGSYQASNRQAGGYL